MDNENPAIAVALYAQDPSLILDKFLSRFMAASLVSLFSPRASRKSSAIAKSYDESYLSHKTKTTSTLHFLDEASGDNGAGIR